jgi:hypothetical protein
VEPNLPKVEPNLPKVDPNLPKMKEIIPPFKRWSQTKSKGFTINKFLVKFWLPLSVEKGGRNNYLSIFYII